MKVGIVGAGYAGLSAAYDLAKAGHSVVVYEAADHVGGLASGFKAPGWDWSLERFYHHIFKSDDALIDFVKEIGADDLLFFRQPMTGWFCHEHGSHALDGALPLLRFPHLPFVDRVRLGAVLALLKVWRGGWRKLERSTADRWMRRAAGNRSYETLWKPLLVGKFGEHYREINMAWLWARLVTRTRALGYFKGGFQALGDRMAQAVRSQGAEIRLSAPIQAIRSINGRLEVATSAGSAEYDAVLTTTSPGLLRRMVRELPADYTARIEQLRSMGAVVMTLALDRQFSPEIYWMMFNDTRNPFPFLALVEHTNYIPAEHYGGQHLVYLGDYLDPDHEYFRLSQDELLERFLPALKRINPAFERSWIKGVWLHRETYAQPIVPLNHSANVPPLQTPVNGLFWASMSQVYPWDRGTNFAVEIGRRAAREMLEWLPASRPAALEPAKA